VDPAHGTTRRNYASICEVGSKTLLRSERLASRRSLGTPESFARTELDWKGLLGNTDDDVDRRVIKKKPNEGRGHNYFGSTRRGQSREEGKTEVAANGNTVSGRSSLLLDAAEWKEDTTTIPRSCRHEYELEQGCSGRSGKKRCRPTRREKGLSRNVRIASVNVGAREGWIDGVVPILEKHNIDLLFVIDTKLRKSALKLIQQKSLTAEVWSTETKSSSMLLVSKDPSRWKVTFKEANQFGCCVCVTNGIENIQGVYARPSTAWNKETERQDWLKTRLEWMNNQGMIIGDLNARHSSWDTITKPRGTWLKKLTERLNLQIVYPKEPTFRTKTGSSTVDLAITKGLTTEEPKIVDTTEDDLLPADHRMIMMDYKRKEVSTNIRLRTTHTPPKDERLENFHVQIKEFIQQFEDVHNYEHIVVKWETIMKRFFASKPNKGRSKQFWTKDCEFAFQQVKEFKRQVSRETPGYEETLRNLMNTKRSTIKQAKSQLRIDTMEKITKARPGMLSQALSLLTHWRERRQVKVLPEDFLNMLKDKSGYRASCRTPDPLGNIQLPESFEETLRESIGHSARKKAPGDDGITGEVLQAHTKEAACILMKVLQEIVKTGILPRSWTSADLVMIPKTENAEANPKDYRPVALLSHTRKVVERAVAWEIQKVWSLSRGQHGYRAGTGAHFAVHLAHLQLQHNTNLRLVCLDLSGAFDKAKVATIQEEISKLKINDGIKRLADIFATTSTWMHVGQQGFWTEQGVAQGSALSPTLWNLFIDTLQQRLEGCIGVETIVYADDVALLVDRTDIASANRALQICHEWASEHNATWNVDKCCTVQAATEESLGLELGGKIINMVSSAKYLGIPFSSNGMDVERHVLDCITKANKKTQALLGLGIVSSFGKTLNAELTIPAAISTFKGFIRPILEYGNVLHQPPDRELKQLEECQNNLLQKILGVKTQYSHALRAATRIPMMEDRLAELRNRTKEMLVTSRELVTAEVAEDLQRLGYPLENNNEITSKASLIASRMAKWKFTVRNWKIQPTWNDGLPPALYIDDPKLSRWVLRWFINSATHNLTSDEQNTAFPDVRQRMMTVLSSTVSWRLRDSSEKEMVKKAFIAIHEAIARKTKSDRAARGRQQQLP
jgi:hypothetical protein